MEHLEISVTWLGATIRLAVVGKLDAEALAALRLQLATAVASQAPTAVLIDLRRAHFAGCSDWPLAPVTQAPVAYVVEDSNLAACDDWSFRMAELGYLRMFFNEYEHAVAWLAWRTVRRSMVRGAPAYRGAAPSRSAVR